MGSRQKKPPVMVKTFAGMKPKSVKPKLAISAIVILLILIAIPPILRIAVPKNKLGGNTDNPDANNVVDAKTLTCYRFVVNENKRVTSVVEYENSKFIKNIMSYRDFVITPDMLNYVKPITIPVKSTVDEIAFFNTLTGISLIVGQDETKVTINNAAIAANSNNLELANYVLGLDEQKARFEGQGYSCAIS